MTDIPLSLYNSMLPPMYQQHPQVIHTIRGRQLGAAKQDAAKASPYMTPELLAILLDITYTPEFNKLEGMQEMRQKVKDKWAGPQGLPADLSALALKLEEYYVKRDVTLSFDDIPKPVLVAFRYYLTYLSQWARENPVIDWALPEDFLVGKRKSSSGFFGFTSSREWKYEELDTAIRIAKAELNDGHFALPIINWYRSQRSDMRNVFGDAMPNLILGRVYLSGIFERALTVTPWVHYHSELKTQGKILHFARNATMIGSVEFDYDKMDQHVSEALALLVTDCIGWALDLPSEQLANIKRVISMYFNVPLITFQATVRSGLHNLFSGVFITNGLENYTSLLVILHAVYIASVECHLEFFQLLDDILFELMGDDSFLLARNKAIPILDCLVETFPRVSQMYGLVANSSKQRRGYTSTWFCKRGYYLNGSDANKVKDCIPIPQYPINLSLNSISYPETGPKFRAGDPLFLAELACILARFDEAHGDPAWGPVVDRWVAYFGKTAMQQACRLARSNGYEPATDWMRDVRGLEWSYLTSPTFHRIMSM